MTTATIVEAVRDRFAAEVAAPQQIVVVPDNGQEPRSPPAIWCRLSIETDRWQQVSTVPARWRLTGRAIVDVHVAIQRGDKAVLELVAAIEQAFAGVGLSEPMLRFQRPSMVGSPTESGGFFRRRVLIDFYADEVGIED